MCSCSEPDSKLRGHAADIGGCLPIVLVGRQMLDDQRCIGMKLVQLRQEDPVVQRSRARDDLVQMHGQLAAEPDILGMAIADMRPQLPEEVLDQLPVPIIGAGAGDDVDGIEMHAESGSVDRPDQIQIGIRGVREYPGHHLQGEYGPLRLHGVDDAAGRLDDQLECLAAEVVRIGAVPLPAPRSGDIDAAARADMLRKLQPLDAISGRPAPRLLIPADGIAPGADLGDENVAPARSLHVIVDLLKVFAVHGAGGGAETRFRHRL